jgi:hypothetical protein
VLSFQHQHIVSLTNALRFTHKDLSTPTVLLKLEQALISSIPLVPPPEDTLKDRDIVPYTVNVPKLELCVVMPNSTTEMQIFGLEGLRIDMQMGRLSNNVS